MSDQEELREDAPEPEDERWEMDPPPAPDADGAGEGPRENGPNPTQAAIDEEGPSDRPVDVGGWEGDEPA
ncbi:MAG: hypothetical protein ACJ75P_08370 [Gaiellaceae bacterium]